MNNIEDIRAEVELRYLLLGRELENPDGWKRVVMRNLFIDQERRKRKYGEVALSGFETLADDADNGAEIDRELYSAINQLSEKQKFVVLERLDKKTFKVIASEMGLSINTVLGVFRYAVKNLRKYMNHE